jgi:hypothetical protein
MQKSPFSIISIQAKKRKQKRYLMNLQEESSDSLNKECQDDALEIS